MSTINKHLKPFVTIFGLGMAGAQTVGHKCKFYTMSTHGRKGSLFSMFSRAE
jgi:hypothetical protein